MPEVYQNLPTGAERRLSDCPHKSFLRPRADREGCEL